MPKGVPFEIGAHAWGDKIAYYDVIGSTMITARELAMQCHRRADREGLTVVADAQTHGRGRRGRTWLSQPGAGLWMTTVLEPRVPPNALSSLGLVVGVAVHRALGVLGVQNAQLKWPNDVLVHGRKLAGILLESELGADGQAQVLVGIGINLATRDAVFDPTQCQEPRPDMAQTSPDDLHTIWQRYIGLHDLLADPPNRDTVLHTALKILHACYHQWCNAGFAPFAADWAAADCLLGQRVRAAKKGTGTINSVRQSDAGALEGLGVGVDGQGALLLRLPDGSIQAIVAGEVEHVRVAT